MRPWSSLRRKLPLLISTLLGVVIIAVCWSAYRQVEGVLIQATGTRLTGVTQRLAGMLEESARQLRREAREMAADSAVVAAITRPSAATAEQAQRALERAQAQARQRSPRGNPQANRPAASFVLWSRSGERVLAVGPLVPAGDDHPSLLTETGTGALAPAGAGVGPFVRTGSGATFQVATPVIGAARDTVGFLVLYRPLAGQGADQATGLIGSHASLLVGNATGDVWTDLSTVVAGPPRSFPVGAPAEYTVAGERRIGVAFPIRATPWLVQVHLPRATALAPARDFVLRITEIALALVALGAAGAWVLSRRVTTPLAEVTSAAEDVARGDYTRRVATARRDELGSLARSFNSMAAQVEAASRALQTRAAELETANHELRASEERYRRLVEAAHEGICAVGPAGTITYANARLAEMLGCRAEELSGHSIFDFMEPATAFEARTRFARPQRGIAETSEVPLRRMDGATLWTSTSGSPLFDAAGTFSGALFMVSDVTERHEAQERLARSERHFRALTENASDMVAVLDRSGVARYVSPALERCAGYDSDELVGTAATSRIHPDDVPAAQAALAAVAAGPGRPVRMEYRYRRKDGGWLHLSSIATNLLLDPAVAGIVVNSRDVTEERALGTQLLQAQKMEAVGQLAGGVAHDFNNLLTVITSYSGMLLTELPGDDSARADIEEIRRAAERAAGLTRQLLAFSRQQVLEPQVLDVNAVVRDIEKMLHRVLREDVRLETALAPGLGRVYADAGQLEQLIVNLAVNARDAMPDGGALTIETADVELDADYARLHAEVTPGPYVMLAVSDAGVGMDAATQARIFEPFFTTKAVGQGTGLGLSTVYGIVKQSGGHIAVYSEPGVGTTFKVYLPRHDSAEAPLPSNGTGPVVHRGAGTVLLVEDEAAVRVAARRILERAGYSVLEAADGREALHVCDARGRSATPIDLLLTDMVMPEMSGRELAARFRELHPTGAIAFMSGYTQDAVLRQGVLEPGAVFVQKPFTPESLTRKLHEARDAAVTVTAAR
jgi:PAS domain S-box-containing protein